MHPAVQFAERALFLFLLKYVVSRVLSAPIPEEPSADRDSTFQVLADGTQDLAALVALFATDSVERYVVDYPQGCISVSMASCSMLGLLGHVRALLKLGLGLKGCEDAAFPTTALRPILGVSRRDGFAPEELRQVSYIQYVKTDDALEWKLVKTVRHSDESMPWRTHLKGRKFQLRYFYLQKLFNYHPVIWIFLAQCLAAGATSFIIVPFSAAGWPWSKVFGTVGLFVSVAGSSCLWGWFYYREGIGGIAKFRFPARRNMAIFNEGDGIGFYRSEAIGGRNIYYVRAASVGFAMVAAVAYVCQYIEVRKTTPTGAGSWLAAQGGLALLRLLYWIVWPYFRNSEYYHERLSSFDMMLDHRFQEIEVVACWSSTRIQEDPSSEHLIRLSIPTKIAYQMWNSPTLESESTIKMINRLPVGMLDLRTAFDFFLQTSDSAQNYHTAVKDAEASIGTWWEFPPGTFHNWLNLRLSTGLPRDRFELGAQIIEINGTLHIWPGLYSEVGREDVVQRLNPTRSLIFQYDEAAPRRSLCSMQYSTQIGRWYDAQGFRYSDGADKGRIAVFEDTMKDAPAAWGRGMEQWMPVPSDRVGVFVEQFERLVRRIRVVKQTCEEMASGEIEHEKMPTTIPETADGPSHADEVQQTSRPTSVS